MAHAMNFWRKTLILQNQDLYWGFVSQRRFMSFFFFYLKTILANDNL